MLLAAAVLAACERGSGTGDAPADSASDSVGAAAVAAAPGDSAGCPETGLWRECNLIQRLERSGYVVIDSGEVVRAFLSVSGRRYQLGREQLEVYFYPSAAARERDLRAIDSARVAPPGDSVVWPATPTLIVSNNLAAILIGGSPRQVERVSNSIRAGLPR